MSCSGCGHANRPGAKFCEECGSPLGRACASCGLELRAGVKFCSECGTPVASSGAGSPPPRPDSQRPPVAAAQAPSGGVRKIVTIVFADLVGSTALHERLDPESARRFMESYYDAMREAVESHGGTVTQLLGDGVKAVFGIPRVAEDDAIRAVRAAVAMQQGFRALAEQQRGAVGRTGLRVAVNTGEVVANDEAEIIGDPVNVAARLQEQGADGDVVVGDSTARLVEALVTLAPLGSFALKGRAVEVAAFRVESLDPPSSGVAAAFVGRDDEIARITSLYEKAVEKPATALAVLLGSPGLGKSRLIDEFARRLGDTATVVEAHCNEASVATFAPLALALRELLEIDADASEQALRATTEAAIPADNAERARIAKGIAALLAGSPTSPEETFFVVRRLFSALASRRPLVLVIDDLQWAEPMLLDLVEHLVEWGSGVPLLVLVGARPELRDKRSALTTPGGLVGDVVTLAGLDAGAAMRLAANVIGAADLPAVVAAKVLATSEGNPLFVGELVRMLVHEGALKREGDRWTTGTALAALEMPPTIHALLAARIERLHPEERIVLERAAVVGRHFSRSAVAELLPRDVADLDGWLESLGRSELIERDTGWFLGEPVLRFHHVLIRDAAYRQLLKGTRAELHIRFADWVQGRAGDTVEHDETIGWHLEQAHQFLRELGPLDAAGRAIGERASTHLAAAGRRALARDDVPLAASLLGRAIERLDPDDPARAELALDWCEALLAAGDVGPAVGAIEELDRSVGDSDRLRAWHTCFAGQHTVLTAPEGLQGTADTVAEAAASLASQADDAGEAKAHYVYALALQRLGKIGACEAALDRALAAARRVEGDRRRANTVLAIAPLAALWGPSPVTRASGRCLDVVRVLRITQGAPAVEAVALSCQGVLEALRGRTDAARRMIASARKMVEELGITQRLLEVDVFGGLVDLLEGDASAAERKLRAAYEGMRELGLGIAAARAAAQLARALLAQDRVSEAEALSHESEALAGDDLKAAIAWRGVRAEALARRGEHAAAVEFASKAVEMAAATDALLDHADARLALAAALRAASRGHEADAEERRASELWETKGATLLAERARREGTGLAPVAASVEESAATSAALRGRVRANAATAAVSKMEAAAASHDFEAVRALFSDSHVMVEHPTGASFGPEAGVASLERLFRSRDAYYEMAPLATLGESLVLTRRRSGAGGAVSRNYDVGAYENTVLHAQEVDEQGLFGRSEVFADDRLNDAIVWLYERYAEQLPEGPGRTRAATMARFVATLMSAPNDVEELAGLLAPDLEAIDHRHLSLWSARGADAFLEHRRALQEVADNVSFLTEEILVLEPGGVAMRVMHSGTEVRGGGTYERPFLVLLAFDTAGRLARIEWFDADREAEALACFDAFTQVVAAPVDFANTATVALDRAVAAWTDRDWERFEQNFALGFLYSGRRRMLQLELDRYRYVAFLREVADMNSARLVAVVLATRGDNLVLARMRANVAEGDVGPSEIAHLNVVETDARGVVIAWVQFDLEDLAAAYAELDARYDAGEAAAHQKNWKSIRRFVEGVAHRDWDALAALCAPEFIEHDHRSLAVLGTTRGAEAWVANFRALVELASDTAYRVHHWLPQARGYYVQGEWYGEREGGAYEIPLDAVLELDERGLIIRADIYDHSVDGALARLAELADPAASPKPSANAATRASDRNIAAWMDKDWDRFGQLFPADFHLSDRRRAVQLELDREGTIAFSRTLGELETTGIAAETLATRGERLALLRWHIDVAGDEVGPSELVHLNLFETDEHGVLSGVVRWDADELAAAQAELDARFAALGSGGPRDSVGATTKPTAVMAAMDRWLAAYDVGFDSGEWDPMRRLCAEDFVFADRRRIALLEGDLELMIASARERAASGARPHLRLLGTAGGRVATWQLIWAGGPSDGRFEIEYVCVGELDESGLLCAFVLVDAEDVHLAQREAWARWGASDPAVAAVLAPLGEVIDAFNEQDAARWHAAFAEDVVVEDHRLAGMGRIEGPDAYTDSVVALWEIAPVTRGELGWKWPVFDHYGAVSVLRRTGTVPDGGDFESEHLYLHTVAQGRITRVEMFELHALDEALARFAALNPVPSRVPLSLATPNAAPLASVATSASPPFANTASRGWEKTLAAWQRRDVAGFAALHPTAFRYRDHRQLFQLDLDRAEFLEFARPLIEMAAAANSFELLATRGERLALVRLTIEMEDGAVGPSAIDSLLLVETSERGDIWAYDRFDLENLDAAYEALDALWESGDAALHPEVSAFLAAFRRGFANRDWDALAALAAADQVAVNHRTVGWGTLSGPAAWVPALSALVGLAEDTRLRVDHLRTCASGFLWTSMWQGTRDGGEFETPWTLVGELDASGKQRRMDVWDTEKLDLARARFESLAGAAAGDPTASSAVAIAEPNAAIDAMDRWAAAFDTCVATGEWSALRSLYAPHATFEDRQAVSQLSGDLALQLASMRERGESGARPLASPIGSAGERVAVLRMLWSGGPPEGRFEIEHLALVEVDVSGRFTATILFDPGDTQAAKREAWSRWAAIDPVAAPVVELLTDLAGAWNARDLVRVRARFADDVVVQDHRHAGLGRIEGADAYMDSNAVLWDLAPEQRIEFDWSWPAIEPHGAVVTLRREGTLPGGGAFESDYAWLSLIEDGRITQLELFEIDALDDALGRFEELTSGGGK